MKLSAYFCTAIALIFCTVSCRPSLHISGTTPSNSPITISHSVYDELQAIATIKPKNGKFSYTIKPMATTEMYLLQTDVKNTIGHFFIAEKGHINVAIDTTGNVRVTGTEYNNLLQSYHDKRNLLFASFNEIYIPHQEKRGKGQKVSLEEINQLKEEAIVLDSLEQEIIALDIRFTRENINNITGQFSLNNLILHSPKPEQLKDIVDAANEETRKTAAFKSITYYIERIEKSAMGKTYTDVELLSPFSESVAITSYLKKEKHLLLYIYVPTYFIEHDSRQLNELYQQYKDKQVRLISVAISEDRREWLKLLDRYNMPWSQLIDATGIDGNLTTLYGLSTFPYFILLDKNGVILYRDTNITTMQLDELIKE